MKNKSSLQKIEFLAETSIAAVESSSMAMDAELLHNLSSSKPKAGS